MRAGDAVAAAVTLVGVAFSFLIDDCIFAAGVLLAEAEVTVAGGDTSTTELEDDEDDSVLIFVVAGCLLASDMFLVAGHLFG